MGCRLGILEDGRNWGGSDRIWVYRNEEKIGGEDSRNAGCL